MSMEEYFGESGERYEPLTRGKRFLLMPAITRNCPPAPNNKAEFLDVACGTGIMSAIAKEKGYAYVGIDISETLLQRAPHIGLNRYVQGSAMELSQYFLPNQFLAVLTSMLLPALGKKEEMVTVLKEIKTVLQDDGTLLVGITHPSFDWYMQAELFKKKGVASDFKGYFLSGAPFVIHKDGFDSHDIHWTLADYADALRKAGFVITMIDECPPSAEADESFIAERSRFPTYMLIVAKKHEK